MDNAQGSFRHVCLSRRRGPAVGAHVPRRVLQRVGRGHAGDQTLLKNVDVGLLVGDPLVLLGNR